jgi:hypothetical protein
MEEPKLFVLTLLAVRTNVDGTTLTGEAGANTVLSVQTSSASAEAAGWKNVYEKYPQSDGWFEHQVTIFELPYSIETEGYHVEFHINKSGGVS